MDTYWLVSMELHKIRDLHASMNFRATGFDLSGRQKYQTGERMSRMTDQLNYITWFVNITLIITWNYVTSNRSLIRNQTIFGFNIATDFYEEFNLKML